MMSATTFVVVFIIATDYINWDRLNHGFLPSNELTRSFGASFILVMDILIVTQDWDFPHFINNLEIKLPGMNRPEFRFYAPKILRKDNWHIHITGKWFNYGILFLVIILDLNMWKNQLFYVPYDYGQYVGPDNRIYTVLSTEQLSIHNETMVYELLNGNKEYCVYSLPFGLCGSWHNSDSFWSLQTYQGGSLCRSSEEEKAETVFLF
ncbi:Transmembrane protein 117 [Acanthosepion pharaonis]|uniref:Transmembrane protein 117 n=1 Tax=Acanthosepion pharaonis TaxID=158019 RepID=A0A812D9R6_ACAPH|nr:Transmembrane protein 117 [Sepia pharaonis]